MNIVTKSGTNELRGSWFTLMRDTAMNAKTETEKITDEREAGLSAAGSTGGSFGGPIVKNKAHFFGAYERTQQDTLQVVDTLGLFPSEDGIFPTPYRETLLTVKGTMNLNATNYLTVRYGRNENSQPYGADPLAPVSGWGDERNTFNSFNVNHNWVLGGSKLNEIVFQYADFSNAITANSTDPQRDLPRTASRSARTSTRRRRRSRRSGSSATTSRGASQAWAASATT